MNTVWQSLVAHKDALEALQSAATTLAIIVGGVWVLYHFWRKRERHPKAKLKHRLSLSPYDDESRVLRVELDLENIGETLVGLRTVTNRLQQVYPRAPVESGPFVAHPSKDSPEISWPQLGEREYSYKKGERQIEPKENDALEFDYLVPLSVETVVVYSYVRNLTTRPWRSLWKSIEIGWPLTETVNLSTLFNSKEPMSTNPSDSLETRQGEPKASVQKVTVPLSNQGAPKAGVVAVQAQGVAKPAPQNIISPPKK